ncbi:hypothetical protein Q5P01_012359 [Channa striata]|uniref:BTB domain-containing protein n=1 Tax=Channa striata TaxID=64152 RepID=A0AA88MS82_CHASR|nr:hypothetical protein Q5P01_012359 [Channa striata]
MNRFKQYFRVLLEWIGLWLKNCLIRILGACPVPSTWIACLDTRSRQVDSEEWKTNQALCTYRIEDGGETMVTVQTSTHVFRVDIRRLSECSEYFRALSQSRMRETSESLIHLDHVSSSIFYSFLEFSFYDKFKVPQDELGAHIQVSSYLLAESFLSRCLSVLADELGPDNCMSYLNLAQEICCADLKMTVFTYLSRNMMELSHLIGCLNIEDKEEVFHLRIQGDRRLCSLRKENLTSWKDPETKCARHIFTLKDSGAWHPVSELPFKADKWCFTAVILYNYLYIIGGYRQRVKRGWEFKMASFRFNPFTHAWTATAPLLKHRRHFSAVACEGCIYAVGGWYLDSLVTPDSSTSLYTAVERYDPWEDAWRFVSSLPLTDFQFTMSLSHDVPLATSLGHCVFVLGSIQRTGEKLLLQYNPRQDSWCELLPTLTEQMPTSPLFTSWKWGQVHRTEKVAFAGQGTVADDVVMLPCIEHNTVAVMDLHTFSLRALPALPISTCYEAVFYLHF